MAFSTENKGGKETGYQILIAGEWYNVPYIPVSLNEIVETDIPGANAGIIGTKESYEKSDRPTPLLDGQHAFNADADIIPEVRETINDYLFHKIENSANIYNPISKGMTHKATAHNVNQKSTPALVSPVVPTGEDFLSSVGDEDAKSEFYSIGNSEFWKVGEADEPTETLSTFMNKTERSKEGGHNLLSDVVPLGGYRGSWRGSRLGAGKYGQKVYAKPTLADGTGNPSATQHMQIAIGKVLDRNRFTSHGGTPFIRDGTTGGYLGTRQGELGVHDPTSKVITKEELRNVGLALMERATGHEDSGDETYKDSKDSVMWPSFEQLQLTRVNTADLRARNVMKGIGIWGPDGKFQIPDSDMEYDNAGAAVGVMGGWDEPANISSYGVLNSHLEPFDGPFPLGMIFVGIVPIGILWLTFNAIDGFRVMSDDPMRGNELDARARAMGDYGAAFVAKGTHQKYQERNLFQELLGIPYTRNSFRSCLAAGINSFYGFPPSEGSMTPSPGAGMTAVSTIVNLLQSPGYYAVVMRGVIRDMEQITKALADFGKLTGFTSFMESLIGLFNAIRTSTTWRFIMTLAGIGDAVLCDRYRLFSPTVMDVDVMPTNPSTRIMKSRAKKGKPALVWGGHKTPSLFLLPRTLQRAAAYARTDLVQGAMAGVYPIDMGPPSETLTAEEELKLRQSAGKHSVVKMGINAEDVQNMERILESEYVPFYFHDLRTNDIISFSAFLSSLGENFAPKWNSTNTMGRIDAIQTYRSTARSLTFAFTILATDPKDFSYMWYKINRLVAMVYPQWSPGKIVEGPEGRRWRMPFSQVPTSSPMIRLRIGDVVKSNYSKFGLVRLFGLGEEGLPISFGEAIGKPVDTQAYLDQYADLYNKIYKSYTDSDPGEGGTWEAGAFPEGAYQSATIHGNQTMIAGPEISMVPTPEVEVDLPEGTVGWASDCQVSTWANLDESKAEVSTAPGKVPAGEDWYPNGWTVKWVFNGPQTKSLAGGTLGDGEDELMMRVDVFDLSMFESWWQSKAMAEARAQADAKPPPNMKAVYDDMKKFFRSGEDGNPIVRSFESARGRGLAGVITTMDLDYALEEINWDVKMGSKAPQAVKVSMSFNVIHDITPGLDAHGALRAPTHPVGPTVTQAFGEVYGDVGYAVEKGVTEENLKNTASTGTPQTPPKE